MRTHTHGYTTTMLQDHKHSASHDHRKWNTTILKHDRATRPQSLEHIHDRRLGKIKYTKVSLYTYLLGVKEKAASQTCICITGSVQAACQSLSEGKLAVQLLWKCNWSWSVAGAPVQGTKWTYPPTLHFTIGMCKICAATTRHAIQ